MRALRAMAVGGALVVAAWAPAAVAQNQSAPAAGGQGAQPGPPHRRGGERHPQIRAAMHALMNAERHLEQAAHDFGGHRAKALELVKQAQEELKAAAEYARAHEGKEGGRPSTK